MRKTCPRLILGALALPLAQPSLAQSVPETPVVLDTITLIGTGLPTEVMDSPASVTVIDAAELERRAPVTITSLLRDVPGLQVSEEGIERVSLRGEASRRVAIMIDGQALTDHSAYGQPILVDPTTIERIEVVRGASSVVSGSRAIGGVINIVTKTGAAKPFALSTTAGWISASEGWRASATASGTLEAGEGTFDYRLSYSRMMQGDRHTPDGVLENSAMSDYSPSLYAGYRLGDHYFALRSQLYDVDAGVYTGDPDFLIDLPSRKLRKTSLHYEGTSLTPWLDKLSLDLYRQTIDREFLNDITMSMGPAGNMRVLSQSLDDQHTNGVNLSAEMKFSASTRTFAGLEYEDDNLVANKTTQRQMPGLPVPMTSTSSDEASIRTFSAFAQHEIDLSSSLTGTFGARWYQVRADHVSSETNGVQNPTESNKSSLALGSAGLVWSPSEDMSLRANLSQGYIYPTLGQLFLTTTAGGMTITGNPDLQPERATTYELGARLSRGGTQIDATLFYTDSRDYIAYFSTGPNTATYENVDSARTWGLEIQAEHASDVWGLTPYVSAAVMRREFGFGNGYTTMDSGVPELSGRLGLRRTWSLASAEFEADLFLRGASAVTQRNSAGGIDAESAGWGTLNLATNMQWDNGLSLVAEFTNLTNRSYQPYEQMPGAERGVSLFLTKAF